MSLDRAGLGAHMQSGNIVMFCVLAFFGLFIIEIVCGQLTLLSSQAPGHACTGTHTDTQTHRHTHTHTIAVP